MFTVDDFIKLLKYFKTGDTTGIDDNVIILAQNAQATTTTLFNENLDLPIHASNDYKRLKEVLVRWYSSLKTVSDVMRHCTDARSLPEEHLNVLLNSFGFTDQLTEITYENKIDFFYDLVNLYKIKGTPGSLSRVLGYFGFPDVDIIEYWLQYNTSGQLVFRPEVISSQSGLNIIARNLSFEQVTSGDPHWMITEDQVNEIFRNNKVSFPSKSPYFGIRPVMELSGNSINPLLAILQRRVQDEYQSVLDGDLITKNISIGETGDVVSILELYLCVLYFFNLIYPKTQDSSDTLFVCWNGSSLFTNTQVFELFQSFSYRSSSETRERLELNKIALQTYFTRNRSTNFLTDLNTAGDVLETINPTFKSNMYQLYIGDLDGTFFKTLLNYLSDWCKNNISSTSPYLTSIILGFETVDRVSDVINFFKPYRARLILVEHGYTIRNESEDAVIPYDMIENVIDQITVDFDTADSLPSTKDVNPLGSAIVSSPPSILYKRIENIYIDEFGSIKCIYYTEDYTGTSNIIYSTPPIGSYRVTNIYLGDGSGSGQEIFIDYSDSPETVVESSLIRSSATIDFYEISNMYLNSSLELEFTYNDNLAEDRFYYSRNTFDNDSYFDIGASIDFIPPPTGGLGTEDDDLITDELRVGLQEETDYYETITEQSSHVDIFVTENYDEKYNAHIADSTSVVDFNYVLSGLEVSQVNIEGGWVETDTGMLFDTPAFSDVCQISVFDELGDPV